MINDLEEIILSEADIEKIVKKLAVEIEKDYADKTPLMIGLLKGCHPFMSDLIKQLNIHLTIDYMDVSSYFGGTKSKSDIIMLKDLRSNVAGTHILIVEDIVDSGKTIKYVMDLLKFRGAKSVEVVTLLNKQEGRKVDLAAKYIGHEIGNHFIIGYGLDYKEKYRNLNAIGIPKKEIIKG